MRFTAFELFAGAGGLSIGLERAGFDVVFANEIESDFAATLKQNHVTTRVINDDIHNIDFCRQLSELNLKSGGVDLLSGGPPCQGFSTVGSKNRQDPRNSLFYEFLRAVAAVRPKYVLFENVAGFFRMYDGEAHKTLRDELTQLGYGTRSALLNAADYGLPQYRERTIVIGWRAGQCPVDFPCPTHGESLFYSAPRISLMQAISDLPPIATGESNNKYLSLPQNDYQLSLRQGVNSLSEHNASNYGEKMQEILGIIPPGGSVENLPYHLRPKSYFKNTYARLLPDEPSPTITRNFGTPSSSRCIHPFQNRALSTREGARLQGFPDDYKFYGAKTSKNLQIGNAVPPVLGAVVAGVIATALRQ